MNVHLGEMMQLEMLLESTLRDMEAKDIRAKDWAHMKVKHAIWFVGALIERHFEETGNREALAIRRSDAA
jgi:hypothetical protein